MGISYGTTLSYLTVSYLEEIDKRIDIVKTDWKGLIFAFRVIKLRYLGLGMWTKVPGRTV